MYHSHKNSKKSDGDKKVPKDCFVERARKWFWAIIILVLGSVIYSIGTISFTKAPAYSTSKGTSRQGGQFQTTALRVCPYCPGYLDSQGLCNVQECPIYSPNWGKKTLPNEIPVRRVLIKELALEVAATQGKGSVIIQTVYPGGSGENADLRDGDKITRFNGRKIKNVKQFQSVVTRVRPEMPVEIKIIRNNEKIKTTAIISEGEIAGTATPGI